MPWNPDIYQKFSDVRNLPFYDLMDMMKLENPETIIDLGCGTAEQTAIIANNYKDSLVLGIDSSKEMLVKAEKYEMPNLTLEYRKIEDWLLDKSKWDLVFSNATLQWIEDHHTLFPKIISNINKGGQLLVQMPVQKENKLNQILNELASREPYFNILNAHIRTSPVLSMDEYAQILFDAGMQDIQILTKVYPIIAHDVDTLYDFISGSALIPLLENLPEELKSSFNEDFKAEITKSFIKFPAIYSFKRILISGKLIT